MTSTTPTKAPSSLPLKSPSIIWKENGGSLRVVENARARKPRPLNPARYFGAAPETDRTDSIPQAWWCPETDTPAPGAPSFEGLLGQTHMIELTGLMKKSRLPQGRVRIVAKCEFLSPGFSVTDRAVRLKVERAEASGVLRQGMNVVSSDSADGGASCAMVCAMRGYPLVVCVQTDESAERLDALKAYGARLVVGGDLAPAQEAARLCESNPGTFFNLDAYDAAAEDDAAYMTLGPEIWDQTNGSVTHWVCHGGPTHNGSLRFLRERNPVLKTLAVGASQPVFQNLCKDTVNARSGRSGSSDDENNNVNDSASAVSSNSSTTSSTTTASMEWVSDQEALETCVRLCREEGIMAGALAGLNVAAALQIAARVDSPSLIVTVLPDLGIKFLSTVFNEEWAKANGLVVPPTIPIPGCLNLQCPECTTNKPCPKAGAAAAGKSAATQIASRRSAGGGGGGTIRQYKRYEDLIGNTPMIDLSHLIDQSRCRFPEQVKVLAKCEFFNPGFSLKDRIARNILDRAEAAGLLKPGMCVVAASSGNTGAATAMLCAMRGYGCVITTCPKCSKEKQDAIKAYGAYLFVTPAGLSEDNPDHYMNVARRICAQNPGLFYDVDQYDTLANPEGHYLTLGPEIWEQSQCEVTHYICAGSTGGTISGVGRFLKERNPKIKVVLADPVGSVFTNYFLSGNVGKPGKYLVEGVGKGSIPGAMDFSIVDAVVPVTDAEAFETCSRLCREEGIWPGGSSGLNVFAALRLAETIEEPCTIVTVMPDMGIKYLTKIYNDEWLRANKLNTRTPAHVVGLSSSTF